MGRGDKKTRSGKISAKSFGNRRPHNHHQKRGNAPPSPNQGHTVQPKR